MREIRRLDSSKKSKILEDVELLDSIVDVKSYAIAGIDRNGKAHVISSASTFELLGAVAYLQKHVISAIDDDS